MLKKIQAAPFTPLHNTVDCPYPSNWHNMLQMTYAVCHLLASKDRCERPCLSMNDWWLVLLPSVSTLSESLVLHTIAVFCNLKRVIVKLVLWLVVSWQVNAFSSLPSPYPAQLHLICQVHIPPWFLHPWTQIVAWTSRVRQVWLGWALLSLQSTLLLSKVFHGGLSKAGFLLSFFIQDCTGTKWFFKVCGGTTASTTNFK